MPTTEEVLRELGYPTTQSGSDLDRIMAELGYGAKAERSEWASAAMAIPEALRTGVTEGIPQAASSLSYGAGALLGEQEGEYFDPETGTFQTRLAGTAPIRGKLYEEGEYWNKKAEEARAAAAARGVTTEMSDISGPGSLVEYIGQGAARMVPRMLPAMAAAGLTAPAGGAGALPFVAAFGVNLPFSAGDVAQRAVEEGGTEIPKGTVLSHAIPHAALDSITDVLMGTRWAGRLTEKLGGEAAKRGIIPFTRKILSDIGLSEVSEVPTEVIQTIIERDSAGLDLFSPEAITEYKMVMGETALATIGFAGAGGTFSAAGEAVGGAPESTSKSKPVREQLLREKERERMALMLEGKQLSVDELLGDVEYGAGTDAIYNRDIHIAQLNKAIRMEKDPARKKALQELRKKVKKDQEELRERANKLEIEALEGADETVQEVGPETMKVMTASDLTMLDAQMENDMRTANDEMIAVKAQLDMLPPGDPNRVKLIQKYAELKHVFSNKLAAVRAINNDTMTRAIEANKVYDETLEKTKSAEQANAAVDQFLATATTPLEVDQHGRRVQRRITEMTPKEALKRAIQDIIDSVRTQTEDIARDSRIAATIRQLQFMRAGFENIFQSPDLSDESSQRALGMLRDQYGISISLDNMIPSDVQGVFAKAVTKLFGRKLAVVEYDPAMYSSVRAGFYSFSTPEWITVFKSKRHTVSTAELVVHELLHSIVVRMPLRVRQRVLEIGKAFEVNAYGEENWLSYVKRTDPETYEYYGLLMEAAREYAGTPQGDRALTDAEVTKQEILDEFIADLFAHQTASYEFWQGIVGANRAFASSGLGTGLYNVLNAIDKASKMARQKLPADQVDIHLEVNDIFNKIIDEQTNIESAVSALSQILGQYVIMNDGEYIDVSDSPTARKDSRDLGSPSIPPEVLGFTPEHQFKRNTELPAATSMDMYAAALEDRGRTVAIRAYQDLGARVLAPISARESYGQPVSTEEVVEMLIPIFDRVRSGIDMIWAAHSLTTDAQSRAIYENIERDRAAALGKPVDTEAIAKATSAEFPFARGPGMPTESLVSPRNREVRGWGTQFSPQELLYKAVNIAASVVKGGKLGVKNKADATFFQELSNPATFDMHFPTYDLSDPKSREALARLRKAGVRLIGSEDEMLQYGTYKGKTLKQDKAYQIIKAFAKMLGKKVQVIEIDEVKNETPQLGITYQNDPENVWVIRTQTKDTNAFDVGFHEIAHSIWHSLSSDTQTKILQRLGAFTVKEYERLPYLVQKQTGLEAFLMDITPHITARVSAIQDRLSDEISALRSRMENHKVSPIIAAMISDVEESISNAAGSWVMMNESSFRFDPTKLPQTIRADVMRLFETKEAKAISGRAMQESQVAAEARSEYFAYTIQSLLHSNPKQFVEFLVNSAPESVSELVIPMYDEMEKLLAAGVDLYEGYEPNTNAQASRIALTYSTLNDGVEALADALVDFTEGLPSILPESGFEDAIQQKGPLFPRPPGYNEMLAKAEAAERAALTFQPRKRGRPKGLPRPPKETADRKNVEAPKPNRGNYRDTPRSLTGASQSRLKVLGNVYHKRADGMIELNFGKKDKDTGKITYKVLKLTPDKLMRRLRDAAIHSKDANAALTMIKKYYDLAQDLNLVESIDAIRTEVAVRFAKALLDQTHPLKPITFVNSYLGAMEDQLEKQAGPLGRDLVKGGKQFRARVARRLSQFLGMTGREIPGTKAWNNRIDVRLNEFTEEEREYFWDWVAAPPGSVLSFPPTWDSAKRKKATDLADDMRDAKDWAFREAGRVWGPAVAKALQEHAPKYYKHEVLVQLMRGKVDKNPAWMRVINQIKTDAAQKGRQLTDEEAQAILDRAVGAMITWNREGLGAMIGKGPEAGSLTHGRRLDLPFGYEKDPLIWFTRYIDEAARFIAWGETMRIPASRFAANLEKLAIDDEHRKTVTAYFKDYLRMLSNRSVRNEGESIFADAGNEARWEQVLKFWIDARLLSPNSWGANLSQVAEIVNVVGFRDAMRGLVDLMSRRAPINPNDGAALDSVHASLVEFSKLAKSDRLGRGKKELLWNAFQPFQMVEYWINRALTPKLSQALLWHYSDGAYKAFSAISQGDPTLATPNDYRSLVMLRNFVYDIDGLLKLWEEAGHVVLTDDIMAEGGYAGTQATQLAQVPEAAPRATRKAQAIQLSYLFKTFQIKRFWNVWHRITDGMKLNAERFAAIEREKMTSAPDMGRIATLRKEINAERRVRAEYVGRLMVLSPVIGSMIQAAMYGAMGRWDESIWYELWRKHQTGSGEKLSWHDFQDYIRMYLQSVMYVSMVGAVLDIADRVLFGKTEFRSSIMRYLLGPVWGFGISVANNLFQTAKGATGDPSGRTLKEGAVEMAGDLAGGLSRYGKPGAGNPTIRETYGDIDVYMNVQRERFNKALQKQDLELARKIRADMMKRYPEWVVRNRQRGINRVENFIEHDLLPTGRR